MLYLQSQMGQMGMDESEMMSSQQYNRMMNSSAMNSYSQMSQFQNQGMGYYSGYMDPSMSYAQGGSTHPSSSPQMMGMNGMMHMQQM